MTTVDVSGWELHNVLRKGRELRTRRALVQHKTPTTGTTYVGGFSIESPNTTEVWHYLFEQVTATGAVTLRCYTEEYLELWSHLLGVMQERPVITWGAQNAQVMVNSPSFSAPLYGLVGGGMITATKATSVNSDTTALDLPAGHLCTFGDRFVIAQGNVLFFNDPGVDPRSFVAENVVAMPGSVYDIVQGPGGALYIATSAGVYTLPGDALGQGQSVQGFLSRVPGIEVSRARNLAVSGGVVAVLQQDHVLLLPDQRIPFAAARGRRYYSRPVEAADLRSAAELYAIPGGFIVATRGARPFYTLIDLASVGVSHMWSASSAIALCGTLRSRDGDPLLVAANRILEPFARSATDSFDSAVIDGVLAGVIAQQPNQTGVLRRLSVASSNYAASGNPTVAAAVNGSATSAKNPPTKTGDLVIGTSAWAASGAFAGRTLRTTRLSLAVRANEHAVELRVRGGDVAIAAAVDLEVTGQARGRRERS